MQALQARPTPRPRVKLVGADGNAFNILALCRRAALHNGIWTAEEWQRFRDEATSGDYSHLLATVTRCFEVR